MKPLAIILLGASLLSACERKRRPWDGAPEDRVADATKPFLPGAERREPDGPWLPSGSATAAETASPSSEVVVKPPAAAAKGGGLWRTCAHNFKPSSTPRRDVERLGALCGPPNGMEPHGDAVEGDLEREVVSHPIAVKQGACYRVFAVAESGLEGFEVTVASVRGSRLAGVEPGARVAVVEPERPFCSFATETVKVEVRAQAGRGRYALRVFQLL